MGAKDNSTFIPVGMMNADSGAIPGDHLWTAVNVIYRNGFYEKIAGATAEYTFGAGQALQGRHSFAHPGSPRAFIALTNSLWELTDSGATDMSGASYTNSTYGVSFATYGRYCYASNGVDPIQGLNVPDSTGSTLNFSDMNYTDTGAEIAPRYICSHKNHLIGANVTMLDNYTQLSSHTTGAGGNFGNQPANDSVQVISDNGADTTQTVTIIGTVFGTDTLVSESLPLAGLSPVTSSGAAWGVIVAVKITGTTAGTVTVRETSGGATITTLAAGTNPTAGVSTPSSTFYGGAQVINMVADGSTTKQVGYYGNGIVATYDSDSQALSGTTTVQSNIPLKDVQEFYIGDVESTRTVTFTSYEYPVNAEFPHHVFISGTDNPSGFGKIGTSPTIVGADIVPVFDGQGEISGAMDGGDCFFVFKTGSIHRFDGPPFVPTTISHTVGMKEGHWPYRQGDRVYFWSRSGLCYIDIHTNEVVEVFKGRLRISSSSYPETYGASIGTWPVPSNESIAITLNFDYVGTNKVHISGDRDHKLITCMYRSAQSSCVVLVYHEDHDCFTLYTSLPEEAGIGGGSVARATDGEGQCPLGNILWVVDSGSVNTVYKSDVLSLVSTTPDTDKPYLLWPFVRFGPKDAKGRVIRVRPVFLDFYSNSVGNPPPDYDGSIVVVGSLSGQGKNWNRALKVESEPRSLDGWFGVPNSKYGDHHYIALFLSNDSGDVEPAVIGGLMGIDVEFQVGPGRTL